MRLPIGWNAFYCKCHGVRSLGISEETGSTSLFHKVVNRNVSERVKSKSKLDAITYKALAV